MNYRHAYHAGNFADVLKHAVLALVLRHLNKKPAAWRFIDTHAGVGAYDLAAEAPSRTGEWRAGIARLAPLLGLALPSAPQDTQAALPATPTPAALDALAPYGTALRAINTDGVLRYYPGSPAVARALARRQDRLTLTELHPEDALSLAKRFIGDQQVKVRDLDGWLALRAFVPPKERRGVVLIDPPFEEAADFDRLVEGLVEAHRRWATGIFMLWHPIKDLRSVEAYERALFETEIPKILSAEIFVRKRTGESFDGCGIIVLNPPFTLQTELKAVLPFLAEILAQGSGASHRLAWIRTEDV